MIALKAVIAREVALERRQNRDVQLALVGGGSREKPIERPLVFRAIGDEESVVLENVDGFTRVAVELARVARRREPVEKGRHVARHDQLRVSQRVHQEHIVWRPALPGERDPKVEHRWFH